MKILYGCLFVLLFICSCQSSKQENFNLEGEWIVKSYQFAEISAMDEALASEWIGKKASIDQSHLSFQYDQIKSYKEVFAQTSCEWSINQHSDSVMTDQYLDANYRITSETLGLKGTKLLVITTGCKDSPFEEIMVKNENEIIVRWDGAFFSLQRKE